MAKRKNVRASLKLAEEKSKTAEAEDRALAAERELEAALEVIKITDQLVGALLKIRPNLRPMDSIQYRLKVVQNSFWSC